MADTSDGGVMVLAQAERRLRPGKTPSGQEVTGHLRRLVRRIRRDWPTTRITLRGDSHYGRPEVMDFCDGPVPN
jgi:hypothetical protein